MKLELKNFNKHDVVVLCGSTLDVARSDTMKGLSSVLQVVKNNNYTNVIVMDTPHRFDLETSSSVNKEVNAFNKKLKKIIKPYDHTRNLNLKLEREHFTKHGLHMNGNGKKRIAELLTSRIMEIVTTHHVKNPIALPWKTETIEQEEKQMKPVVEETAHPSSELQVNEKHRLHLNSVKQNSERVHNIV